MPSQEDDPTRTSDTPTRVPGGARRPDSASPPREARFAPGTIVARRYRVVSFLGRGGMGEVYRADDLKLEQPIALKFLPDRLARDPARLARFLNEVRVARQVTHPNVCRVHDVGEAEGQHFISLARQVCLGLAAAHERGVLHRDLKPANVMVDGRGRARLTDFGLAVAVEEAAGSMEIVGTPAYMAPEQLEGRGVTERSDVYALGLLLYEIFTGRPAFRASSLSELIRLRRESAPVAPSSHVRELDPALDQLILRCLEQDPASRPRSAIAVAAALPGGSALEALVAAGETPPPELVAAAGGSERVPLGQAWAAFALVVVGLPLGMASLERLTTLHGVPKDKPPAVLLEAARRAARLAAPEPATAVAWGFEQDASAPLASRLRVWYREAPRRLDASGVTGRVRPDDPPLAPGMLRVRVDSTGRLLELVAMPGARLEGSTGEPDWAPLLERTAVEPSSLRPAEPGHVPPVYADRRVAWSVAGGGRIEAGSLGSRPVFLTTLPRAPAAPEVGPPGSFALVWFAAIVFGGILAARNLRLGRGDRQGALRVALWVGTARLLERLLLMPHTSDLAREHTFLVMAIRSALFSGAQIWLLYVAIEPALRRRWPTCLVAWARLLRGQWRDPLVGRDVLAGMAGAVAMGLLWAGGRSASGSTASPIPVLLEPLQLRGLFGWLLDNQIEAVASCLWLLVLAVLFRWVFRDFRLAALAIVGLFTLFAATVIGVSGPIEAAATVGVALLLAVLLLRFGMLAVVVTMFFLGTPGETFPVTLDFSAWYGQAALGWLLIGYAIAGWALHTATAGRPFPRTELLEG
jgi:serine/threonine-protein kinase